MLNLMGMCKYYEQVVWDYLSVNLYLCEWVVKKKTKTKKTTQKKKKKQKNA